MTRDNIMIALRRYPAPGRPPVVMLNGVFQNMNAWDLPLDNGSEAKRLRRSGFDVWLVNYRNHGVGAYQSGCTRDGNCNIDDLALLDLPAVLEHVAAVTLQRPFIVGHSMGGMIALMHLMGLERDSSGRVKQNSRLARHRNRAISGLCLVGTPLPISWRNDPGLIHGLLRPSPDQNLLYRKVFGSSFALWLCSNITTLPAASALNGPLALGRFLPVAGGAASRSFRKLLGTLASSRLCDVLWESKNIDREMAEAELLNSVNNVPAGILYQLCDWIRHETMRECAATAGASPLDYMAHLGHVTAPVLMVAGERDRSASAAVAYGGFKRLGSRDKRFVLMIGIGHNDLRIGKQAPHRLSPLLSSWLGNRARSHTSQMNAAG